MGWLDYSSEDLVEISVTWGYKTFTVEFPAIGNEQPYKYFRDVDLIMEDNGGTNPCTDPNTQRTIRVYAKDSNNKTINLRGNYER